jgi:uncharacterized protein YcfJ
MKKITLSVMTILLAASLLCACTNREMGTAGGAALGGVVGYAVGGGTGAAVGAVGGGIIGNTASR